MKQLDVLLNSKATTAKVNVGDIKLGYGSGADTTNTAVFAEIHGTSAVITPEALAGLYSSVGINNVARESMNQSISRNASLVILQEQMNGFGKKGREVTMALKGNATISRIVTPDKNKKAISKHKFVEVLENIMGRHGMSIDNIVLGDDKTTAKVNITAADVTKGLSGEDIRMGTSFDWDMFTGTSVYEYFLRMICTNGMIGEDRRDVGKIWDETSADEWYKLLFQTDSAASIADKYFENVERVRQCNLSVREYFKLSEIFDHYHEDGEAIKKVMGDGEWMSHYLNRGVDPKAMKAAEMANYETPINMWDALNEVTRLASHDTQTSVQGKVKEMDKQNAGKMLFKTADAQNWNKLMPKMDWSKN